MKKHIVRTAVPVLLACLLAACSPKRQAPAPVVVTSSSELAKLQGAAQSRDPALRQIGTSPADAAVLGKIDACRAKLPEEYRKRNNFAWAWARIDGMEKAEFFAHSSIQDMSEFSSEAADAMVGISLKPPEPAHFHTLCVNQAGVVDGNDCWARNVDTEFKILEDIAARLPDTSAAGHIQLFTELYPCPSCWNVMKQFLAAYSNVEMEVLYRTP